MLEEVFKFIFSQLKRLPKQYYFPLAVGLVGLIVFIYGLIHYFGKNDLRENQTQPQDFTVIATPTVKKIKIDIEGAVENPGVYSLTDDSRVEDGLISAGGLSSSADRDFVSKQINLAAKLTDGMKIYIPHSGEIPSYAKASEGQANSTVLGADTTSGLVSVNSASEQDLEALPGVGPVTAQKIISGRPYATLDDLTTRKAITKSTFEKIKDKISL